MRVTIIVLLCFLAIACGREKKKPEMVLSEAKLVRVLIDYNLAQGINSTQIYRLKSQRFREISIIDSVYAKHGISKEILDSSLSYYSRDPKKLDAIYDNVITEFRRRSAEIQAELDKKQKEEKEKETNLQPQVQK